MSDIGKMNNLKVLKDNEAGIYLDALDYGELLLPRDQVPIDYQPAETLDVFLYCDSKEQVQPTTKRPYAAVGEFACLEVIDVLSTGAFLDWGLPKDLFVPLGEQREVMKKGQSYVVYVTKVEGRNRMAASSRLDAFLDNEPVNFKENEKVRLLVCHQTDLGFNAIINNMHWGLLYKDEIFQPLEYGQRVEGFIKKIRKDGKIDLSLQVQGYQRVETLEEEIIAQVKKQGGELNVTDKSDPDTISELFGVSKKKYKMALGALYKAGRIIISDDVIKLK
ncbi:S1 RNA-binding domain-containing protein [Candidatus Omnitrophota bacterium]